MNKLVYDRAVNSDKITFDISLDTDHLGGSCTLFRFCQYCDRGVWVLFTPDSYVPIDIPVLSNMTEEELFQISVYNSYPMPFEFLLAVQEVFYNTVYNTENNYGSIELRTLHIMEVPYDYPKHRN